MKKKISIVLLVIVFLVAIYEGYLYFSNRSNSFLAVSAGSTDRLPSECELIVNDEVIDTINLNVQYPYINSQTLSFGRNSIKLNGIDSKIQFETSAYFYGLYTWNVIDITSQGIVHKTHYTRPILE